MVYWKYSRESCGDLLRRNWLRDTSPFRSQYTLKCAHSSPLTLTCGKTPPYHTAHTTHTHTNTIVYVDELVYSSHNLASMGENSLNWRPDFCSTSAWTYVDTHMEQWHNTSSLARWNAIGNVYEIYTYIIAYAGISGIFTYLLGWLHDFCRYFVHPSSASGDEHRA